MLPSLISVGPQPPPACRRHRDQTARSTATATTTAMRPMKKPVMHANDSPSVPGGGMSDVPSPGASGSPETNRFAFRAHLPVAGITGS